LAVTLMNRLYTTERGIGTITFSGSFYTSRLALVHNTNDIILGQVCYGWYRPEMEEGTTSLHLVARTSKKPHT